MSNKEGVFSATDEVAKRLLGSVLRSKVVSDLPAGFEILVGAGHCVMLLDPLGDLLPFPSKGDCVRDDILAALKVAVAADQENRYADED